MKTRFSTLDIIALLPELQQRCRGMRVLQVYSVNSKTFLIRLGNTLASVQNDLDVDSESDANKVVLLLESGTRMHITDFNWPKEAAPNGFAMKLRKHLKNRRLESIQQLGLDRIVDMQFGSGESAYHIIHELYDRGNLVITDYTYTILNVLRPRREGENEDVKFKVREVYPVKRFEETQQNISLTDDQIDQLIRNAKAGENLKRIFNPKLIFGPALLEHAFIEVGLGENCRITANQPRPSVQQLQAAFELARQVMSTIGKNAIGVILQKEEDVVLEASGSKESAHKHVVSYLEFHPMEFVQHLQQINKEAAAAQQQQQQQQSNSTGKAQQQLIRFESFNKSIDLFFSSIESQKIEQKTLQKEKDALKKLDLIRKDHEKRLQELDKRQADDDRKGRLIEVNTDLVDRALMVLRSAIAQQMSWDDIRDMIKEAQDAEKAHLDVSLALKPKKKYQGDLVASSICSLKLQQNLFTMELQDPYEQPEDAAEGKPTELVKVDIDLDLSAYANARRYFDEKKRAKKKEDKTIDASAKALKNAQLRTAQTLKEIQVKSSIIKARKIHWFEKFFWFISSDNYIIIAGRDAQQNELIVKRYLKPGDLYVHADLHGGSTVVIKNLSQKNVIPSRTIEEAGTMAVCYSNAWDSKMPCRAWWVNANQVSKTAPSGEYLTVGAFMIRGKKNYIPLSQLVLGFGFLFRLADDSIPKHAEERKIKTIQVTDELLNRDSVASAAVAANNDGGVDAENQFPDTEIHLDASEEAQLLSAQETRFSSQKNAKQKKKQEANSKQSGSASEHKRIENYVKPQQQPQIKQKQSTRKSNKKGKGKSKNDDWSDDESGSGQQQHMQLKLMRKQNKGDRLLADLQEHIGMLDVAEDDEANTDAIGKDEAEEKKDSKQQQEEECEIVISTEPNAGKDEEEEEDDKEHTDEDKDALSDKEEGDSEDKSKSKPVIEEEEEEEQSEEHKSEEYVKLIASLTGQPQPDDELLYMIPMVGPYTALQNNKFKVKILPGTSRRGKISKSAVHLFTIDRQTTSREKDLLRSTKDQDVARNLPNKLKLVAQNMQTAAKAKAKAKGKK